MLTGSIIRRPWQRYSWHQEACTRWHWLPLSRTGGYRVPAHAVLPSLLPCWNAHVAPPRTKHYIQAIGEWPSKVEQQPLEILTDSASWIIYGNTSMQFVFVQQGSVCDFQSFLCIWRLVLSAAISKLCVHTPKYVQPTTHFYKLSLKTGCGITQVPGLVMLNRELTTRAIGPHLKRNGRPSCCPYATKWFQSAPCCSANAAGMSWTEIQRRVRVTRY